MRFVINLSILKLVFSFVSSLNCSRAHSLADLASLVRRTLGLCADGCYKKGLTQLVLCLRLPEHRKLQSQKRFVCKAKEAKSNNEAVFELGQTNRRPMRSGH